ncbi:MAG: hypothetical protein K6T66_06625 [Peptococcaceae bacterium]|nr:hypothetical protein [Peptococcaceae bacterium]
MITILEYVEWKQPHVAVKLKRWIEKKVLALSFRHWKSIMEERPKPGLGGLLEKEKAVL